MVVDGFSFIEKVGAANLPEIVFVTAYDEPAVHRLREETAQMDGD